mmetsp:Transcript_30429/g.78770  ORF Transcript_30429/g.78770 Transcript_30429/m.78770 type:complete len:231 (+) Transcript_30429:6596-7288(+)
MSDINISRDIVEKTYRRDRKTIKKRIKAIIKAKCKKLKNELKRDLLPLLCFSCSFSGTEKRRNPTPPRTRRQQQGEEGTSSGEESDSLWSTLPLPPPSDVLVCDVRKKTDFRSPSAARETHARLASPSEQQVTSTRLTQRSYAFPFWNSETKEQQPHPSLSDAEKRWRAREPNVPRRGREPRELCISENAVLNEYPVVAAESPTVVRLPGFHLWKQKKASLADRERESVS